jgi:hypothetical protein
MQSLMINVLKNTDVILSEILNEGGEAMESIACT